jgi:pimeloyl-ACP methyl ester carboxylesterase
MHDTVADPLHLVPTLPSPTNQLGLLFVHGIFGHPNEFKPAEAYYRQQGYVCRSITLPAHGASPTCQLTEVAYTAFIEYVAAEADAFAELVGNYCLVGHSLGGMLALAVASQGRQRLQGVVSIGAALESSYLVDNALWLRTAVPRLWQALPYVPDYWHGNVRPTLPLLALPRFKQQARLLMAHLAENLPNLAVPTLLAHSPYDLSVPYEEMHKLYDCLCKHNVPVTTVTLEACGHQVFPLSRGQAATLAAMDRFLASLPGATMSV